MTTMSAPVRERLAVAGLLVAAVAAVLRVHERVQAQRWREPRSRRWLASSTTTMSSTTSCGSSS